LNVVNVCKISWLHVVALLVYLFTLLILNNNSADRA